MWCSRPRFYIGPISGMSLEMRNKMPVIFIDTSVKSDWESSMALAHELAHALVWGVTGLDPNHQDELAGFMEIERMIWKEARLSTRHRAAWMANFQVPDSEGPAEGSSEEWGYLSKNARRKFVREAHRAFQRGRWALS